MHMKLLGPKACAAPHLCRLYASSSSTNVKAKMDNNTIFSMSPYLGNDQVASVLLAVPIASRHELPHERGVSHLIKTMSFNVAQLIPHA